MFHVTDNVLQRATASIGCWCLAIAMHAFDSSTWSDPRPAHWTFLDQVSLDADALKAMETICDDVHRTRGAEIMVVVTNSTAGQNHRSAATQLFNRWAVGSAARNDGIVIFAALSDRRVEIILGKGIESAQEVAVSQNIVDQTMVPIFRAGQPAQALVAGTDACARRLLHWNPPDAPPQAEQVSSPHTVAVSSLQQQQEPAPRVRVVPPADSMSGWWMVLGGGAGVGSLVVLLKWRRNRPRTCPACRIHMVKLDEYADDKYLDKGECVEERIHSVDYDIWICEACHEVLKLRYGSWITPYGTCPQCRQKTKEKSRSTLVHATEFNSGTDQITEHCVHCQYHNVYTRTTPRLSSTSTNDFGSSSSASSFSSSSSSSSSPGGGSSSGSGGGGSW